MKSTPVRPKNVAMRTVGQVSGPLIGPVIKPIRKPIRKPVRKPVKKPVKKPWPIPTAQPNLNTQKLMNGFVSFRSTIQELNQTLQQLVTIMGGASKMFFGRDMLPTERRLYQPELPSPPVSKQEFQGEEIPVIELPKMPTSNSPLLRMLGNIDMAKMMKMIQSPVVRNILTRVFPVKQATAQARTTRPRKRNVRKRVRP